MDPITPVPVGEPAPDFSLPDLSGSTHRLVDVRRRVAILNFWSAECPWAERADRELLSYLPGWGDAVVLWNIASNSNEPYELLARVAGERGLRIVLRDEGHQVADLYGAQTTPHVFVIDAEGILRYQGAIDDVNFRQRTATRFFLRHAVEAVLAGRRPDPAEVPAYGCTVVRFVQDA